MLRAARLDAALYEEVEADPNALWQATSVVVLSSLAAGIGDRGGSVSEGLVLATLATLLGWYIWAYLTYLIGTRLLPGSRTEADWGQLLRTIGFASAPGVVRVVGVVLPGPPLTDFLFLIVAVWMLVAMVIAVRQALDYESTGRALGVCVIGWVVQLVVASILLGLLNPAPLAAPKTSQAHVTKSLKEGIYAKESGSANGKPLALVAHRVDTGTGHVKATHGPFDGGVGHITGAAKTIHGGPLLKPVTSLNY
jgi:hypothetical protein